MWRARRIRIGTGVITLPLENALRVAEDAAVLDLLTGGRLEVGLGTGGTAESFEAFGVQGAERGAVFARNFGVLQDAWAGRALAGGVHLYPAAPQLLERVWQATFSAEGGARAGANGDGLMLSRTQPRPEGAPQATLSEIQNPIIDAYLARLPAGRAPRILGSRTLFVADRRDEALRWAEAGLRRVARRHAAQPSQWAARVDPQAPLADLIAAYDVHVGTPDEVIASLRADTALARVSDIVFQVHSIDPPHDAILRSIELTAAHVAPAWAGAVQICRHPLPSPQPGPDCCKPHDHEHHRTAPFSGRRHRPPRRHHPGSALDRVRRHRTEARTQAQQSFAALFTPAEPVPGTVSLRERLALAAFTAGLHGEPRSAAFYAKALAAEDAELAAAVASEVVRGRAQSLQPGSGPHGPYGRYPAGPLSREDQSGPAYAVDPAHAALLGARLAAALAHAHLLAYHPRDASAGPCRRSNRRAGARRTSSSCPSWRPSCPSRSAWSRGCAC